MTNRTTDNADNIRFNSIVITCLYALQGLVIGFLLISLELKLKSHFSYSDIGIYLMCSYPFSLKLLWSPIVDTFYLKSIGVKKSWIIPTQLIAGSILIYLSFSITELINDREIVKVAILAFSLMFVIATQDIAVDSWTLTLTKDVSYYIITYRILA
jgi:PAT family acetyl-CoA transporter-like MFS transporter 1